MKWPWTRARSREQLLSDHFDGALRGREARDVEADATGSDDAQQRLAEYARLRDAVRGPEPARDDQSDEAYLAAVMARVAAGAAEEPALRARRYWLLAPASGLALAAIAFVVWRVVAPADEPLAVFERGRASAAPAYGAVVEERESTALSKQGEAVVAEELALASKPSAPVTALVAPAPDPVAGATARGAEIDQPARDALVTLRSGDQAPTPGASASHEAKLLPYRLRIVDSSGETHSAGLQAGAELTFSRSGVRHTVSVGREDDGRWSVASAYQDEGALVAAERRERLFRLSGASVAEVASHAPLARFRIAQPLVGTDRIYAEVVATGVAPRKAGATVSEEGSEDAPE